ncbi:ribonuclease J [Caproicibacterium amylolyticum]|uniref:Ribonuclease J n=1 Tax=Caproicibacterium amylolyticum TaxID=2766537 RepID=A0A7G9WL50_9FIRM|nr:ribonuclease J [Caproicibacterium amylolyticum]MBE6721586.1 ribonuclease J [Oscillospiraceae bacterium]QNO19412.1 ribonuclease J [Caproicibacterium amylolyticum]
MQQNRQQQPAAAKAPREAAAQQPAAALVPAAEDAAHAPQEQPHRRPRRPRQKREPAKPPIHIAFLGGLNEVGKNMTLFECQGDMFLLDCGMAFPDDDMLGIDLVLPDFTYVEKNADRIKGIVLTHGHEDHIGALPYLLKKVNLPLYGTPLTLGLVKGKLKEHGLLNKVKMNVVNPGDTIRFGCIGVEMIHVNHSIPDAVGVAIHSPAGTIVHTGDFKIDCTPVWGEMIDLGRFAQLGKEGVLALMADSTNAERPGFTKTEKMIANSFESMFRRAENKRIIVASFASNISRVQQIVDCAVKYGRKVALSGRSMVNVMSIGVEMGYLHVPEGVLIDIDLIKKYPKDKIVLITTGSQGEPMSALSRMAFADHRKVEVGPDDFIIISARPIPGNEKSVGNVIDELMKRGCEVEYGSMYEVHVSGHACQEELKLMQGIVKPKYFIPVHGEQKMLHQHARLAYSMGKRPQDVCIANIGDVIELSEDHMKRLPGAVPAGNVLVDGLGVGDVGSIVLRDRKHLAEDGLIVVVCTISSEDGHVVSGPDVVSRGFVYVRESENLIDDAKDLVFSVLEQCADNGIHDWGTLKTSIKDSLSHLLYDRTRRSPMILPIIMEV